LILNEVYIEIEEKQRELVRPKKIIYSERDLYQS